MKALLVTSSVTYVPGNYEDAIDIVVEHCRDHIAGVLLVDVPVLEVIASATKALFAGCTGIARTLIANLARDVGGERERRLRARGVNVWRVRSMNEPAVVDFVAGEAIDVVVNMRTRCIYRDAILRAPRLGCINVHHGILPTYRGLMCDLHALADGRPAGFSIHAMTKKIDDGAVFHTEHVSRGDRNYLDYLRKTGLPEGRAVATLLTRIAETNTLPAPCVRAAEAPVVTRALDLHTARQLQLCGMRI